MLTVAVLAGLSFSASAQTKLASVDLKKVFDNYWKKTLAYSNLTNKENEYNKDLKVQKDGLINEQNEYKQLLDQANDPALSTEERDKRRQAATAKAKDMSADQSLLEQTLMKDKSLLADEYQRVNDNLRTDIQKVVADKAKAGGYTLVLNATGPDVLYVNASTDLTDAVLKDLNAGAPEAPKPASAAAANISTNLP
jgi:Skp family chaperone for outer membrane proteins